MYKIGFYNEKIDDKLILKDCNIIFNNFDNLKNHIRYNDTIILASSFSLFEVDIMKILDLKNKYNLNILTINNIDRNLSKSIIDLEFNVLLGYMEFIKANIPTLDKLIREFKEDN